MCFWLRHWCDAIKTKWLLKLINHRGQNSGQLLAITGSNCHLGGLFNLRLSENSRLKVTYFYKMIALFSILKQLPTVVMMRPWRFLCCVESCNRSNTAWKVSVFEVFLVRIFPHLDWIRSDTPHLSVFSPNAGKYGP